VTGGGAPLRLVILTRPEPVMIYTTNRVAELVPVTAVVSETGGRFAPRQWRRLRLTLRKRGVIGTLDRYLDLAYFKIRARRSDAGSVVERMLGAGGKTARFVETLEVHEVDRVNSPGSVDLLRRLAPDLIFCNGASILRRSVIGVPRLGVINIHTGIVPEYRGPTPEFWALYNGDFDHVGVTVHYLTEEIDAGDIILQERTIVEPGDDELTLRCKNVRTGARLVAEAVRLIAAGKARAVPQDGARAGKYGLRTRHDDRAMRRRLRARRRELEAQRRCEGP